MERIPQLPTTKQFRDAVKTAFRTHGIKMTRSRTQQELLSDWDVNHSVRMHYNYRDRNLSRRVRRVDIWIPRCDDSDKIILNAALDGVKIWMTLSGVNPLMKVRHPSYEDSRITAWCLIS